jgi:hypothetical protein
MRDVRALVAWMLAYQRPLRRLAVRWGPIRAAPVAVGFLVACLLVSLAWAAPGAGHRLAVACCAYRGWRPSLGATVRLVGGAFLLRHWYEIVWTVAATALVTAPFEAWVGSGRMLVTIALGHLVPTVAVAAAGLAHDQRLSGGGLDVGASAAVAAAAAGLAVRSRSLPVAGCLLIAQAVAALAQSPLATAEHLTAIVVGGLATAALSRLPGRRSAPAGCTDRGRPDRSVTIRGERRLPARRQRRE